LKFHLPNRCGSVVDLIFVLFLFLFFVFCFLFFVFCFLFFFFFVFKLKIVSFLVFISFFNKLGGLAVVIQELNNPEPDIRMVAAWILGKASPNNPVVQRQV
jgi:hypothetical protein